MDVSIASNLFGISHQYLLGSFVYSFLFLCYYARFLLCETGAIQIIGKIFIFN